MNCFPSRLDPLSSFFQFITTFTIPLTLIFPCHNYFSLLSPSIHFLSISIHLHQELLPWHPWRIMMWICLPISSECQPPGHFPAHVLLAVLVHRVMLRCSTLKWFPYLHWLLLSTSFSLFFLIPSLNTAGVWWSRSSHRRSPSLAHLFSCLRYVYRRMWEAQHVNMWKKGLRGRKTSINHMGGIQGVLWASRQLIAGPLKY